MDEMFAKAESEQDEEVRKDIYRELIAYLVDYCPSIPLFHHELVYAWNSQLNATVHDSYRASLLLLRVELEELNQKDTGTTARLLRAGVRGKKR